MAAKLASAAQAMRPPKAGAAAPLAGSLQQPSGKQADGEAAAQRRQAVAAAAEDQEARSTVCYKIQNRLIASALAIWPTHCVKVIDQDASVLMRTRAQRQAHASPATAQVLLDFLRLLRQRKVVETQSVQNQLAGLETDVTEAQGRLERVLTSAASARQLPLPAADRLAAAMRAASGGDDAEPSSAASPSELGWPALRSRSLPSPPLPIAASANEATAVPASQPPAEPSRKRPRDENDDQHTESNSKQAAATRLQTPDGVLTASKVARIMAAFPAADVAYLARRAEANLGGRRVSVASARPHVDGVHGCAVEAERTSAALARLHSGAGGASSQPAGAALCPSQPAAQEPADDHLTLFMEDIAAFTRYREMKVRRSDRQSAYIRAVIDAASMNPRRSHAACCAISSGV